MPTPSPRLGIPIYQEADTPVDIPAAWTARTAILDKLVPIDVGSLTQRPVSSPGTAGIVGRQFITTSEADSPRLDLDLGSSWIKIGPAVQDGVATTPSARTLGSGPNQAAPGNDTRFFAPGDIKLSAVSNPQGGWLLCDGSGVSRVTYVDLWNAIGTGYGAGDGSTTFNVPDLRSRVPVGAGTGAGLSNRALGSRSGEENHALTAGESGTNGNAGTGQENAQHGHAASYGIGFVVATYPGNTTAWIRGAGVAGDTGVTISNGMQNESNIHGHPLNARNADSAHNNMQPYIAVNYFIKT